MILDRFISRSEFSSYEDFVNNYKINVPQNFNFAFDVVDEIANTEPGKLAMAWCDDKGAERNFTFGEMKEYSNRAANFFKQCGIGKGDKVMLVLKRRYEFWFAILGLHKIGAITIPATHLLTEKDIVYRNNAAGIRMLVCVPENEVIERVEKALGSSPTISCIALIGQNREGWLNFTEGLNSVPDIFKRPTGKEATRNEDSMLLYFTSGTTGMPKMVNLSFTYPLGHILTAKLLAECCQ